jgi:hypothetical protein
MKQPPSAGGKRNIRRAGESDRPRVQRFQFGPWLFNVDQAQALIAESPREPKVLPVAPWARFYGLDSPDGPGVSLFTPHAGFDRDYAMTTDLRDPVLIATLRSNEGEEFPLLIDGTHRLYRAHADGLAELPAYVLTADESLTIREGAFLGSTVYWPGYDPARLLERGEEPGNDRS